jgi:hypothetical protein
MNQPKWTFEDLEVWQEDRKMSCLRLSAAKRKEH